MHNALFCFHLIIFKSAVHIEVTAVGGQWWEVEAFEAKNQGLDFRPNLEKTLHEIIPYSF